MKVEIVDNILIKNAVTAIFVERNEEGLCAGVAVLERYGMRGWVAEIEADTSHPYAAIDKLLHLLFISGSEEIIIASSERSVYEEIAVHFKPYRVLWSPYYFISEEQNILFREVFELRSLLTPLEHFRLEERPMGAQALAHLASAFRKSEMLPFALPVILEPESMMDLGNNPLEQLEIVSSDPNALSVFKLLGNMRTPMGNRLARFRLFMPIRDQDELNRRYDWVEWVTPHSEYLEKRLDEIGDIETLWQHMNRAAQKEAAIESFRAALSAIESMMAYCAVHKLALNMEWDEAFAPWITELRHRMDEPIWLKKQVGKIGGVFDFIARIDVAVSTAQAAKRYGLCRPGIVETQHAPHFLQIMALRHLLVEEQGRAYVPNDIVMGSRDYLDLPYPSTVMLDPAVHDGADIHGVMLYGINSSGKSSLMKSIGIAVVLAQSGFYVPAKAMKFSLFEGVYTRIVSRDNVAKSLSTFGVEMLELNSIFAHAGPKTLILGDEISHGTETLSAVAIVASTVMELSRKGALFLITTHLHQLSMVKELSALRQVVSLHLSVRYDETKDSLIYDRQLRSGRGSSVYGLEFARSLHMDENFLRNAQRLRENLAKEYDILELGHQKETIKRYREVVASECVICGALVRNQPVSLRSGEHHHLIPLCDTHRRRMVEGKIKVRGFIMTQQGLRLEYETQLS